MDDLWMTSSDKAVVTGWLNFKLLRIWMKVKRLAWWSLKVKIAAECDNIGQNFGCVLCLHQLFAVAQKLWYFSRSYKRTEVCSAIALETRPSPPSSKFLSGGNLHQILLPEHLTRHPVSKLTTVADHTCSGYRGLIQFSHGRSYLAKNVGKKIVLVLFSQRKCSNQIPSSPEDSPDESQVAWRRHMIQKY
jgi:hypothetical protein